MPPPTKIYRHAADTIKTAHRRTALPTR